MKTTISSSLVLRQTRAQPTVSLGSCFAVSPDGLILTNHHVIAGAELVQVTLSDGRTLSRAWVESDSASTDLALLKVEASGLEYLPLATLRSTEVGMEVFTMGFPAKGTLGSEPKFTDGTISSLSGVQGESSLLQTTVPIQPGNSGGPLVSHDGFVVGVVTSTAAVANFMSQTGALPQNVNWAVKADYAVCLLFDSSGSPDESSKPQRGDRSNHSGYMPS